MLGLMMALCENVKDVKQFLRTASGPSGPAKTKTTASAIGAKNWNHGAYSPRTGWLYLPVLEICNDLIARFVEMFPDRFRGVAGLPQNSNASS